MRKRKWLVVLSIVGVLILSGLGYYFSGSSMIESWVGSQILALGGSYLGPDLHFKKLTYVRPKTILLEDLSLTAPNPADQNRIVTILSVKHARLELTEIPQRGQPIKFTDIVLDSPQIHAIAQTPGGGDLVGFSNFVKNSSEPPKPESKNLAEPVKLSDVLQIRHIEINNGAIRYDSRQPNMPALWLGGINAKLDLSPVDAAKIPGVYAIATTVTRKPAFEVSLSGQLNVDTFTLSPAKVEMTVDLQERNAHFLPPEIQNVLKAYEVTGLLRVSTAGSLPILDAVQCDLLGHIDLDKAQVAVGKNRFAIDAWNWEFGMSKGVATIQKSHAQLLNGQLGLTGQIPLDATKPAHLELNASNLKIQKLLRENDPNQPPEYAGNVTTSMMFQAPLASWNSRARGGGELSIRQGRLANIPVLGTVIRFIRSTVAKALGDNKETFNDVADASFSFVDDRIVIHKFTATSGPLAMRGDGDVTFNQQLNLRLNAGPMERLQNSLGAIGRAWASISDSVAGYRVTGTLKEPDISVEVGR